METFTLRGESDFITITFEEVYGFPDTTCCWGGYDVRIKLEIKSGNFRVNSTLWTSTGELYDFLQRLKECNNKLAGAAIYNTYEGNLKLIATYDDLGHVNIKGRFSEQTELHNELQFEFSSDQTFIRLTIEELELVAIKYGDMKGIEK